MPAIDDPEEAAASAGLRYVLDDEPGIERVRCGRGFTYRTANGRTLRSVRHRERIERLAVPPSWTNVWICGDDRGHIQATGRDARDRKQYRYHDAWAEVRSTDKFEQLAVFGVELAAIRSRVAADLGRRGLSRERVLALVIRLLDETLVRVGNPEYARGESFGLTTLEGRHLSTDDGVVHFEFKGKSGIEHDVTVADPQLVGAIGACDELGGRQLFTYRDGVDVAEVSSDDVNDYLRDIAGSTVSARDFRTWGGTVVVVEELGPFDIEDPKGGADLDRQFLAAVDVAAERLGNTRAVCRGSYVHPAVEASFRSGVLHETWRRSRRTKRLTRAERTTLRLLVDEAASR